MKATAVAPSNIAFIKYWGKADESLRLPLNTSVSMNLSGAYTKTTVEFSSRYADDAISLIEGVFSSEEEDRIIAALDRIRKEAHIKHYARVVTENTFPKGTGAAASASGFAALTVAAFAAAKSTRSEKELTIFARQGSGSACRSIPDGFVLWEKGTNSDDSYAYSLYPHTYWDLRDILVIVDFSMKKVSTTVGQKGIKTSPFWKERIDGIPKKVNNIMKFLKEKNFQDFGQLVEEDCLNMHQVMQTQTPPVYYWNEVTKKIMSTVIDWRKNDLPVYFTIDAGPNIHLICEATNEKKVMEKARNFPGTLKIIVNKPAGGTKLVSEHLF